MEKKLMPNQILLQIAPVLLGEKIEELKNLIDQQTHSENSDFLKYFGKIYGESIDMTSYPMGSEIPMFDLFLAVTLRNRCISMADWSGEEYPGHIKRSITLMLKQKSMKPIKWKKNTMNTLLTLAPRRGEFLPLLFQALNTELEHSGISIGFLDCYDDAFYFFVLPKIELEQIVGTKGEGFVILDTHLYDISIIHVGNSPAKVRMYLKNKFEIPLNETLPLIMQDTIFITTGNMSIMNLTKTEIEALGATIEIKQH